MHLLRFNFYSLVYFIKILWLVFYVFKIISIIVFIVLIEVLNTIWKIFQIKEASNNWLKVLLISLRPYNNMLFKDTLSLPRKSFANIRFWVIISMHYIFILWLKKWIFFVVYINVVGKFIWNEHLSHISTLIAKLYKICGVIIPIAIKILYIVKLC